MSHRCLPLRWEVFVGALLSTIEAGIPPCATTYSCAIATEFPICNAENYHIGGSYCDSVGRLFAGASPPDEACGMVGPAND